MRKIIATHQNYIRTNYCLLYEINDNYVVFKSGSMYEYDYNYVAKQRIKKAKIRYCEKCERHYFLSNRYRLYLDEIVMSEAK